MKRFDTLISEVWRDLQNIIPADFKPKIAQITFIIQDHPSPELLQDLDPEDQANPQDIYGLHIGVPLPQASLTAPELFPVRVYLFRHALLELVDPEDPEAEEILREEIAVTLLHEIGHFFGLSEEDLERLGYD